LVFWIFLAAVVADSHTALCDSGTLRPMLQLFAEHVLGTAEGC
jgi:hypothetical protein